jgi:hypothetical protein
LNLGFVCPPELWKYPWSHVSKNPNTLQMSVSFLLSNMVYSCKGNKYCTGGGGWAWGEWSIAKAMSQGSSVTSENHVLGIWKLCLGWKVGEFPERFWKTNWILCWMNSTTNLNVSKERKWSNSEVGCRGWGGARPRTQSSGLRVVAY